MKQSKLLYVANWKNYFTHTQAIAWITEYKKPLATLAHNYPLVICPSLEAISAVGNATHGTEILLGAQNCSAHAPGAYTGQVLIESLKQLSCSYCIIGHAEVQQLCPENAQVLAAKAIRLIENGICPILCIGESAQDYELSRGSKKLDELLIPFFEILHNADLQQKKLCIAYEPLWAINSNSTPTPDYIAKQLEHIKTLHLHSIPELVCLKLYGGGVDETNTREFKNIDALDGFLIGRASTDFQKLQKIVEL